MLVPLVATFEAELRELEARFAADAIPVRVSCPQVMDYNPWDDGCVISLWDLWNRHMRSLYLACASGVVHGVSNTRYAPTAALTEAQALAVLVSAGNQKGSGITIFHGEPKWFIASSAIPIASALGLSNGNEIANAVGQASLGSGRFAIQNPVDELQECRNYIAHKSVHGMLRVSQRFTSPGDLSDHLREKTLGGSNRFADWCDGLVQLAWDAAL